MKILDLDFIIRVRLAGILEAAQGPLGRITALQHVYAKVRLTEEDLKEVEQIIQPDGRVTVKAPKGSCLKQITIENSEAITVLAELDNWQGYQVSDLEWLERFKEQLRKTD